MGQIRNCFLATAAFLLGWVAAFGAAFAVHSTSSPSATPSADGTEQTVTLHVQDKPRDQVLAEFGRAAHMSFADPARGFWMQTQSPDAAANAPDAAANQPPPPVSLDIENEPFWLALSHLQEAMDIGFVTDGNGGNITPTHERGDWGWTGRPETVAGPLFLSVRQVNRRTTVPLDDSNGAFDRITVMMRAFFEPGTDWTIDSDGFEFKSLRTDQGLELELEKPFPESFTQPTPRPIDRRFSAFAPTGTKINWVTLSGNVHCIGAASHETIEIPNALPATLDRRVAGFDVHLATRRAAGIIEVRLTSKLPPGSVVRTDIALRQKLSRIWDGRVKMYDANDVELISRPGFDRSPFSRAQLHRRGMPWPTSAAAGLSTTRPAAPTTSPLDRPSVTDHIDLILNFSPADAPPPFRIVWTPPTALDQVLVPMKIEEIPVP